MKVLKFGGTSVGSADSILKVRDIVKSQDDDVVVVVSAVGGVTDQLIKAANLAKKGDHECFDILSEVKEKHYGIISELFPLDIAQTIKFRVDQLFDEVSTIIKGVYMLKEITVKSEAIISSFGERVSSFMIAQLFEGGKLFESQKYIKTDKVFGKDTVDFEETERNLLSVKDELVAINVFPGFIACNKNEEITTLGRGGSDYTAAIIAATLDASVLEIWTDVNGFMTADPRIISRAYCIDKLSYQEAMELSHFGAKVIYPPTILPVYKKKIPILIKNTFNPEAQGTLINDEREPLKDKKIKGISSIKEVALLTIQGIGMIGVTGIAMRLFKSLAQKNINVILISQASSENSISIVIESKAADKAVKLVEKEFKTEIALNQVNNITVESDMAVIAIVGENMKHTTGISGKLFNSMGRNGVNIYAIAQGASELNISFVVKEKDLRKGLNTVHEAFFLSHFNVVNLFVIGTGTVGKMLIEKINSQSDKLFAENKLKIRVAGITNSRKMLLDPQGLDTSGILNDLMEKGDNANLSVYTEKVKEYNLANSVVVDCTANAIISEIYQGLLESNVSVVTANKIATSSDYASYQKLKETALNKGVKFLFETNVGAGLPIIAPLNDLVMSGDKILGLEAVLSGTLNYIVNTVDENKPLSDVIQEAKEKGYSEPDPRIDLSGTDVVRKILILAREAGYEMEQSDIEVVPFVPQKYMDCDSLDQFMEEIKEYNGTFEEKRKELANQGKKLRYGAKLENGKATVGFIEIDKTHPFFDLEGSNNIILINSEHYKEHPMQIKGYGAGADVTAAGVFADIIKVANK
ncbi:bifunctional aspartate kinase/homoserine dehydrogenase I [Plebeiibacterium marinum]|uniref:Bifunctional aspartate kinase/homoserine dehydrogenase I n=1 Tax=Plebeiibacterium marinum TaxID=2992111 RepID=A0AAE3MBT4_9BACT|nr:bifunctional aspartate kinase/homoserine dehydrogenase I [Plebeiobacterium marinum]MCW3804838.1 bifunctional aspartate kinase/homoserine dehydrogenase I [Plebeiobacterium marinum]